MRIERIEGVALPEHVAVACPALVTASASANIFYEPWLATPSAALPEARGIVWLAAWQDKATLAGLLPVQPRRMLKGLIAGPIQNWDQRVRALGDPIVRAGQEEAFWDAILAHLDRRSGAYLRLSTLNADSAATKALLILLERLGRPAYVSRTYRRAQLLAGPSSGDYIAANIRKKVLKEHRRLRSRLDEQGGLVFDSLGGAADPARWIDDLFRLELTGWKGRDGVAAAAEPDTERCFRAILTEAHRLGRLDFRRMSVGGQAIAMLANIESGDTAFQLKIAYDEAYAAYSPGVLIEMEYLRHALDDRKLARVDSCARAGHPMIDRIWIDRLEIISLAIPLDRWSSRVLCAAQDRLRARAGKKLRQSIESAPDGN